MSSVDLLLLYSLVFDFYGTSDYQRWSPRGQILKSLALASKVKSLALALASRPQALENWPVLVSRTALFFELLKFCGALEKFFGKRFFVEIAWKIFVKTFFFFWRALALVSLILGLGLEASSPRKLACPRLEDSTIFWIVKILWSAWKIFWKTFFCGDCLKNFCEDLFFFWRALALVSLILGLGLEASSPRKLACPRLEDSTIFWIVKILWSAWKIFWKTFFCGDRLKNFCEDLFCFGERLRLCPWSLASSIPVLGLESVCPRKGCPWPWHRIFVVSLALASSFVSSTPPLQITVELVPSRFQAWSAIFHSII